MYIYNLSAVFFVLLAFRRRWFKKNLPDENVTSATVLAVATSSMAYKIA
jgi:uncharacterized membrane protein (DUF485 family)